MIPTESVKKFLEVLKVNNQTIHLFVNNVPDSTDNVVLDYQELVGLGYTHQTLDKSLWLISKVSGIYRADYQGFATFNFTSGTPQTVYGSLIKWSDGTICSVKRFVTPKTVGQAGENLSMDIQPYIGGVGLI